MLLCLSLLFIVLFLVSGSEQGVIMAVSHSEISIHLLLNLLACFNKLSTVSIGTASAFSTSNDTHSNVPDCN